MVCAASFVVFACALTAGATAQERMQPVVRLQPIPAEAQQDQTLPNADQQNPAQPLPGQVATTLATLHGMVRNALTGEGIPRALVQIEGDAQAGALTDGDGRFEVADVPVGPQAVRVQKPGFFNAASGQITPAVPNFVADATSNVLVAAEMADVDFTLAPSGAIRGRIDLSTGEPAEDIGVVLMKRVVEDGRAAWQQAASTKTRSDGAYRFGGLSDGQYEVYTTPEFDGELLGTLVAPGKQKSGERWGYASVAWPAARALADAQAIPVTHGAEAQANFSLTREPFQAVSAEVTLPRGIANRSGAPFSTVVMDGAGHELPYAAGFDAKTQTVQAALPQGSYTFLVVYADVTALFFSNSTKLTVRQPSVLEGAVDFAVADHAVTNLRVPLSAQAAPHIDVSVNRTGSGAAPTSDAQIQILDTPVSSGLSGDSISQLASGSVNEPLETANLGPGSYWLNIGISADGLCESSFTAGGANLAREPLVVGAGGVSVPLELTLRDDCAQLTVALPQNLQGIAPGIEPVYTVYVVPDFDSTRILAPLVLRPSTGTSVTLSNLTPGSYHVYTLMDGGHLEYHNPAVLAALTGQQVTLAAGAPQTVTVEAPAQ